MFEKTLKCFLAFLLWFSLLPLNGVSAEESGNQSQKEEEVVVETPAVETTDASVADPSAVPTVQPSTEPTAVPETVPQSTAVPQETEEPVTVETAETKTAAAMIADQLYATFDEAYAAAKDNDTIIVLADCKTEAGINLNKNISVCGNDPQNRPVLTFGKYGMALWAKSITFRDIDLLMNNVGSTPYTTEWGWVTICAQSNSEIRLINSDLMMDGDAEKTGERMNKHAIFADNGLKLYMENSNVVIQNYKQDALEWNGGGFAYNVEMINSSYLSDHNRSGFAGTFKVKATHSTIDVINSSGNGSNGSNFYFTDCVVNFLNNGSHGLSATVLEATRTPIRADNNGLHGIVSRYTKFTDCKGDRGIEAKNNGFNGFRNGLNSTTNHKLTVKNSDLVIMNNGFSNPADTWSGLVLRHVPGATMDASSTLRVEGNANNGIRLYAGSDLRIEEGADVIIMNNLSDSEGGNGQGGGIRLMEQSKLVLPSDATLYNNHADLAGDDIYLSSDSSIAFGPVGNNWMLDSQYDCEDQIDDWYYDGVDYPRWKAHGEIPLFVRNLEAEQGKYTVSDRNIGLKAAHGLKPETNPDVPMDQWTVSKSKEATNLNPQFETTVTLSLPATEQQVKTDVVFVLDKSTSAELKEKAREMMRDLNEVIRNTQAQVNIGIITFNKVANRTLELTELNDENLAAIDAALDADLHGGTNLHAGIAEGKTMLDEDTAVDPSRKYLITVSDGITYMFGKQPTAVAWSFDADGWRTFAGPDNWKSKYGSNNPPADWNVWLKQIGDLIRQNGDYYDYPYGGEIVHKTEENFNTYRELYANSVDKGLYLAHQAYTEAQDAGYRCFAFNPDRTAGEQMTWGTSFIDFLANGEKLDFNDIRNEIIYFLDEGSRVEDYIGYTADYDFDLIPDTFRLTVGGQPLAASRLDENKVAFGDDQQFTVEYVAGDRKGEEHFVWYINTPIKVTEPVKLSYDLKLTDPKEENGTYGQYDRFGTENSEGLFTNNSAVLYPVDSLQQQRPAEAFNKPAVSYVVEKLDIPVIKIWDDEDDRYHDRPDSVTVILNRTVNGVKEKVDEAVLSEENGWKHTFVGLPVNENGVKIDYTVDEIRVHLYTTIIEREGDQFVITNRRNPVIPDPTPTPAKPDKTPDTSDSGDLMFWVILLALAGIGAGVFSTGKKCLK